MARISTKLKIERHFTRQVWAVLRSQFIDCKSIEDAAKKLTKLTKGKIDVKPLTIFKMIEQGIQDGEVKEKDFYYSWGIPKPKTSRSYTHLKGKRSTRTKIEEYFKKDVWNVFSKDFKECKDRTEVASRLSNLTEDKISVTPITIFNLVGEGIKNKEVTKKDFYYKWGIKSEGGHRGKVSIRHRIEKYTGKDLWDWFREHFADITTRKEACERISQMTGGTILVGEQTIVSTIEKGLKLKEITSEDPFVCWSDRKRRHKNTEVSPDTPQIEEKTFAFTGECKNCGQGARASITKRDFHNLGIGITGKRCLKCGCWASFIFKGNINGKDLVDEKKDWKQANPSKFKKDKK